MRQKVDDDLVRSTILDAIGEHATMREAQCAGVYVHPVRDLVVATCMPLAPRFIHSMTSIPWASRVEFDDLEGAALEGIVEGVDRYQPRKTYKDKPIKPSTYLYLWIRKRVLEEVAATHWAIMRPPRALMESYFKDGLEPGEREAYMDDFLRPVRAFTKDPTSDVIGRWDGTRDQGNQVAHVLSGTYR